MSALIANAVRAFSFGVMMENRRKDIGFLKGIQWLAMGCFVAAVFTVLAFMITAHDWSVLVWFPVAMLVYFLVQTMAFIALSGGTYRPRYIGYIAYAPLIAAALCLAGILVSFVFWS